MRARLSKEAFDFAESRTAGSNEPYAMGAAQRLTADFGRLGSAPDGLPYLDHLRHLITGEPSGSQPVLNIRKQNRETGFSVAGHIFCRSTCTLTAKMVKLPCQVSAKVSPLTAVQHSLLKEHPIDSDDGWCRVTGCVMRCNAVYHIMRAFYSILS